LNTLRLPYGVEKVGYFRYELSNYYGVKIKKYEDISEDRKIRKIRKNRKMRI